MDEAGILADLCTQIQGAGAAAQGRSARDLGVSPNTIRKYLRSAVAPQYGPHERRVAKLAAYQNYLLGRIETAKPDWIPAVVVLREIRELGYRGGLTQLKAFVNAQKTKLVTEPLVRFKTEPGEQMQVAFVVFRRVPDRLSAFAGRLLGLAQLDGAAGILVQDVVDVLEGLLEHALSVPWVTAYPLSTAGMVPPNAER